MLIRDLEICNYHSGPFTASNWLVPLLAVGWLEHPQPYTTGLVPDGFDDRLELMVNQFRKVYATYNFRGCMECSICKANGIHLVGPIWSQENLFIPGDDAVYVAPGGIVHYIQEHHYLPPEKFIQAVLRCPEVGTVQFGEALQKANCGCEPPLESEEKFKHRMIETQKQIFASRLKA
ncbi:MAG: hypothetical protein WAN35_00775 [Terracidiphilus sp.]